MKLKHLILLALVALFFGWLVWPWFSPLLQMRIAQSMPQNTTAAPEAAVSRQAEVKAPLAISAAALDVNSAVDTEFKQEEVAAAADATEEAPTSR